MINTQLLKIVQTFSAKDKRNARYWIDSPMHNKRTDVKLLYDFVWQYLQRPEQLSKQAAWQAIYPKVAYKDGKMRQIIFQLQRNLEHFLQYQQLQQQPTQAALLLLDSFAERQCHDLLDLYLQQAQKLLKQQPAQNWQTLRQQYQLETIIYEQAETAQRTSPLNLQELSDTLDVQYFADKLRRACLLYSRLVVFQMDYQPRMLEVVLAQVADSNHLSIPAIAVYYYCYLSLTAIEQNDHYFEQMMQELEKHRTLFPAPEVRDLYLLAINYTIKRLNTGSDWHLQKAFELYQTGIREGFLLVDNQLSAFTYNNIVSIGISIQKYNWVEQFMKQYQTHIAQEYQQGVVKECWAKLYYAQKKYAKAQTLLAQIDTKDILRLLSSKILLAQIYYETQELDALESLLHSLKTYLYRKEVVGYHRQYYQTVVTYMLKLLRNNSYDLKATAALRTAIETANGLTPTIRKWLLQQF